MSPSHASCSFTPSSLYHTQVAPPPAVRALPVLSVLFLAAGPFPGAASSCNAGQRCGKCADALLWLIPRAPRPPPPRSPQVHLASQRWFNCSSRRSAAGRRSSRRGIARRRSSRRGAGEAPASAAAAPAAACERARRSPQLARSATGLRHQSTLSRRNAATPPALARSAQQLPPLRGPAGTDTSRSRRARCFAAALRRWTKQRARCFAAALRR